MPPLSAYPVNQRRGIEEMQDQLDLRSFETPEETGRVQT